MLFSRPSRPAELALGDAARRDQLDQRPRLGTGHRRVCRLRSPVRSVGWRVPVRRRGRVTWCFGSGAVRWPQPRPVRQAAGLTTRSSWVRSRSSSVSSRGLLTTSVVPHNRGGGTVADVTVAPYNSWHGSLRGRPPAGPGCEAAGVLPRAGPLMLALPDEQRQAAERARPRWPSRRPARGRRRRGRHRRAARRAAGRASRQARPAAQRRAAAGAGLPAPALAAAQLHPGLRHRAQHRHVHRGQARPALAGTDPAAERRRVLPDLRRAAARQPGRSRTTWPSWSPACSCSTSPSGPSSRPRP